MFVACKTCSASYHIPDEIFGAEACQFRCARCGRSWELAAPRTLAGSLLAERAPAPLPTPRRAVFGPLARRLAGPIAIVAALAGGMGALAARAAIVAALPASGALYAAIGLPVNATDLAIDNVTAHFGRGADATLLAVEGELANRRQSEAAAPNLRIALRSGDGRELYVWTIRPPKDRLRAGERAPFLARLAAPPPGIVDALVKFAAPGDKLALGEDGT